jgi:hypothetical protein
MFDAYFRLFLIKELLLLHLSTKLPTNTIEPPHMNPTVTGPPCRCEHRIGASSPLHGASSTKMDEQNFYWPLNCYNVVNR